ncbi:hypothetical protein ACLI1A_10255 [Flavobacterium sp. RHBU_3]|uniref:hypothetical protein n=1 Tax=Flavobacterium sp. RHBU_3 TaxID=3391184 RepID=UPI003984D680
MDREKFKEIITELSGFPKKNVGSGKLNVMGTFRVAHEKTDEGKWFLMENKQELLDFLNHYSESNTEGEKRILLDSIFDDAGIKDDEPYYIQFYY